MKHSISDKEFLNNYIRFAAVHRWRVANACFDRLRQADNKSPERAHLALEILCCYLLLMEDILLWFHALKKSQISSGEHLMDVLHKVRIPERGREAALEELNSMTTTDFMRLLGCQLTGGESQLRLDTPQEIENLHRILTGEIKSFLNGNSNIWKRGTFVKCLNKIKHALLVMRTDGPQDKSEFIAIFPDGTSLGSAMDQATLPGISSENNCSEMILSQIVLLTFVLVGMLTVTFRARFGCSPEKKLPNDLVKAFKNRRALGRKFES